MTDLVHELMRAAAQPKPHADRIEQHAVEAQLFRARATTDKVLREANLQLVGSLPPAAARPMPHRSKAGGREQRRKARRAQRQARKAGRR